MNRDTCRTRSLRIAHEIPDRIRLICPVLNNPAFDTAYLEAFIGAMEGVEQVRVNIRGLSVVIRYNGDPFVREKIIAFLDAPPDDFLHAEPIRELKTDAVNTISKTLVALFTRLIPRPITPGLSIAMSLPVLAQGMETLLNEGVKVDVLDGAAVGISLLRKDYFTANAITALLGLGEYLEGLSEVKTTGLLKSLVRPQMEKIRVERDGHEIYISSEEMVIGDHVICGPGEMIPVDGVVITGQASVNQSSINGEFMPIHAQSGTEILSGAVVEEGKIVIRAETVGTETGMARIKRFLENSLRSESKSQKQSDELADRLVPLTFVLGLASYLITGDARKAASVLTVDYSCAIKMATPIAVRMGIYAAAHCGVLIKGAQAMDALSCVDTIVFDKTGTLTAGNLKLTDLIPFNGISSRELLALAAGAEEHYAHPVAHAVVNEAKAQKIQLPSVAQVDFIVAHGVSAYVDDKQVRVGSYHFIHEDENIDCSEAEQAALSLRREGKSLLYVAYGEKFIGLIGMMDKLRPEAVQLLQDMKASGIVKTVMLTGDHQDTAKAIAGQLDYLDEVHWELTPEDKADIVKKLQSEGRKIAFIGDGVNDALALVSADVGICMPDGADLAKESAQIILLKEDMTLIISALQIAAKNQQTIKNCFYSAVGMNSLILFFALSGAFSPVVSATLHNTATLSVLSYAALAGRNTSRHSEDKSEQELSHVFPIN